MINGLGAHIDIWQPLARELSRTRRLIMFDSPGCGKSSPRGPLRMRGMATLVVTT